MIRRWDRHLYVKTKEVDKGSTVHRMAINQDLAPNWKVKRLKDTSLTTAHCHQMLIPQGLPLSLPHPAQIQSTTFFFHLGRQRDLLIIYDTFMECISVCVSLDFPAGHLCFTLVLEVIKVIFSR